MMAGCARGYSADKSGPRALNAILAANFEEFQIFRTDHYVGKETVQNILAFRSWGPRAADELLAREGHAWRPINS